jgi:hypothetical protein
MTNDTATAVLIDAYGVVPTVLPADARLPVYRRFKAHGQRFVSGLDLREYAGGKYAPLVDRYAQWEGEQPQIVTASDVGRGDYLLCPRDTPRLPTVVPEWPVPSRRVPNQPPPLTVSASAAWLFGLYIADGYAVAGHRLTITLGIDQTETIDRAVSAWGDLGLDATVLRKPTFARVVVYSSVAANAFREWFGTRSAAKRIPNWLLSGWDSGAILEGVAAGDGCDVRNSGQRITTVSWRLAAQLHRLLIACGERPSWRPLPRGRAAFPNAAPGWGIEWHDAQKQSMRHWRDYYLMPVRSVAEATGDTPTQETREGARLLLNNILVESLAP